MFWCCHRLGSDSMGWVGGEERCDLLTGWHVRSAKTGDFECSRGCREPETILDVTCPAGQKITEEAIACSRLVNNLGDGIGILVESPLSMRDSRVPFEIPGTVGITGDEHLGCPLEQP